MNSVKNHIAIIALGTALVLALPACGKRNLDKSVDKLVNAALANDYKTFKEMSHPELVEKFSATKFKELSDSLKLLGKFKDRSMRGIKSRSGRIREGRYKLTFEKGVVQLKITLKKGKLMAFRFTGEDLEKALRKVRINAISVFKVHSSKFLDEAGKDKNNVFKSGQKMRFKVIVHGLKRATGTHKLQVGYRLMNPAGKVLMKNPNYRNKAWPVKPDALPAAQFEVALVIKTVGSYKLEVRITDGHTGKSLTYSSAFIIE